MTSRVFPILRRIPSLLKPVAHNRLCYKVLLSRNTELIGLYKYRNMNSVSDDVLNEPARNLDYNQLLEKKKEGKSVIIDVREQSEIDETGKLPGSIHIPLGDVEKALKDLTEHEFQQLYKALKPDHDTELIFSCRSGKRSLKALKTALELGYKKASHYKGGWLDWAKNSKE